MAKAATNKALKGAAAMKTIRTNPYAVKTMRTLPVTLMSQRARNVYGWEELTKPKQYKTFDRAKFENARQAAMGFAKEHGFEIKCVPATDDDGKIVTEPVWITEDTSNPDRKTVKMMEVSEAEAMELNAVEEGTAKLKSLPVQYWIIRTS